MVEEIHGLWPRDHDYVRFQRQSCLCPRVIVFAKEYQDKTDLRVNFDKIEKSRNLDFMYITFENKVEEMHGRRL